MFPYDHKIDVIFNPPFSNKCSLKNSWQDQPQNPITTERLSLLRALAFVLALLATLLWKFCSTKSDSACELLVKMHILDFYISSDQK